MTEFEKWVNTRGQSKNEVDPYAYCFAEEAWKAALEWALSTQTSIGYSVPVVLVDTINKELKEIKE